MYSHHSDSALITHTQHKVACSKVTRLYLTRSVRIWGAVSAITKYLSDLGYAVLVIINYLQHIWGVINICDFAQCVY